MAAKPQKGTRKTQTAAVEQPGPRRFWPIAGVFLIAAFFRFYNLDTVPPGLHHDEAIDAVDALDAAYTGHHAIFYPANFGREGLYINVESFVLSALGSENVQVWKVRCTSALFGVLTVVGLFFLTRVLTRSDCTAGAAAFFAATSFWHIDASRIATRAISSPFFLVWAIFFLLWGFAQNLKSSSRRGYAAIALAGFLYGAGFHTYIPYRLTPILILGVLLWLAGNFRAAGRMRAWINGTALFLAIAAAVVLPLALYFLQHPATFSSRTSQVSVLNSPTVVTDVLGNIRKTLLMFNVSGDLEPRHNIPGRPELFLPVGILFLCGVAWGIRRGLQRSVDFWPYALCFLWAALAAVPPVLSNAGVPHALRSILMIPPCLMLAALATGELRRWLEVRYSRNLLLAASAALALVILVDTYTSYFDTFANDPRTQAGFQMKIADLAREVAAAPLDAPKYILMVGEGLDANGNPQDFCGLALLSGGYSARQRELRNLHFATTPQDAGRIAHLPGGPLIWVLREQQGVLQFFRLRN